MLKLSVTVNLGYFYVETSLTACPICTRKSSRIKRFCARAPTQPFWTSTLAYPYVTSSSTTIGGVMTGLGVSPKQIDCVIGVVKAYTTRVGHGPFPTELNDSVGQSLRDVGHEYGTTTGRPRRCGWLDVPMIRYSHRLNGYDSINVTKLDVLTGLQELKICVAYKIGDRVLPDGYMPASLEQLQNVEPIYVTMPGWSEDISKCSSFDELPRNAKAYVLRMQQESKIPVSWIGVGPDRSAMFIMPDRYRK